MSFLAPYAFTGAISLYLGYQTYSSYYSNLDFEEINNEDIDIIEDDKPISRDFLVKEGKKRGEEIKIIIEEVKDEIEDLSYRNVSEVIEKTLEKIEEEEPIEETTDVVLSPKELPETVFPEVKTSPKKKKKKKKNKKK